MKANDLIFRESQPSKSFKYDTLSVILIGLGRIVAGNYFLWNAGLKAGVIPFYVSNIFWSIGVTCMSLCLAEMASALPFTGGVYGFARGLIGPYVGFLVGICEFVGNIVLLGTLSIAFGQSVSTTLGLHDFYILPFFLVPLSIAALLQYTGSKHFGFVVKYLSVLSLILLAIYVFGSMAHVSVPRYGNNPHAHPPSMTHKINQVLSSSNFGCSFFIGMESIPVISSAAKKPHESIPRSLFVTTVFYYISFTAVILLASWQRPGTNEVEKSALPLSYGYANIFGISDEAAAIFSAPAALTSCVVCTYYMCVTLRSMAQSGVLPSCVAKVARFKSLLCSWGLRLSLSPSSESKTNGALETAVEGVPANDAVKEKGTIAIPTNSTARPMNLGVITASTVKEDDTEEGEDEEEVPYVALGIVVTGTAITTVLVLCGLLFYVDFAYSVILFGLYSFWFIYFAVFATYLVYCSRYREKQNQSEERFKSPLGVYGALLGMVVTVCMIFVSNYPYLEYQLYTLLIFIASLIILSVVYVKVVVHYQRFSPEEEKVFFIAYIIRANRRLKENMRKGGGNHLRQQHAHLFNMNFSNNGSPSSYRHSQDIEANNQQNNKNSSYSSHLSYHKKGAPSLSHSQQSFSSLRKPVASPHIHSYSMQVNTPTLEKLAGNTCSNSNNEEVSSDTSVLSHVWYFLHRRMWFVGSGGLSPAVVAVSSESSADAMNQVSHTNKLPLSMKPSNATLQETSGSVSERVAQLKNHSEDNQVEIFSTEENL